MDRNEVLESSGEKEQDSTEGNSNRNDASDLCHEGIGLPNPTGENGDQRPRNGDEASNVQEVTPTFPGEGTPEVEGNSSDDDDRMITTSRMSIVLRENLDSPLSKISFTSTDATHGSLSPSSLSLDDELMDDAEGSQDSSTMDLLDSETTTSPLNKNDDHKPNSPYRTSPADIYSLTDVAQDESSVQEQLETLKLPGRSQSLDASDMSPTKSETSGNVVPSSTINSPDIKFTVDTTTDLLLPCTTSSSARERETAANVLDSSLGDYGDGCKRKNIPEDKSVRRKTKKESQLSTEDYCFPSTSSAAPPASSEFKYIGRTLRRVADSMERSLNEVESRSSSGVSSHFRQIFSFCERRSGASNAPTSGRDGLLKAVNDFFRENPVDVVENINLEEAKQRITLSNYFIGFLRQKELCLRLIQCGISEHCFVDYCKYRLYGSENCMPGTSASSDHNYSECSETASEHLWRIEKEMGLEVITDLFRKLTREGLIFNDFLPDSSIAAEGVFQGIKNRHGMIRSFIDATIESSFETGSANPSESVPLMETEGAKYEPMSVHLPLLESKADSKIYSSRNKTIPSEMPSRDSEESSNVDSADVLDPGLRNNKPYDESTVLSDGGYLENPESSDESNT